MAIETTDPSARRPSASAPPWRLVVLHAPAPEERGVVRPLGAEPVRLGRKDGGAELALDDPALSPVHAVLEPTDGGGWRVRDDSGGGLFVDGEAATQADLHDGSVVRLGGSLLLLERVPSERLQAPPVDDDGLLVGKSLAIDRLRRALDAVAASNVPVLLLGETGVGKGRAARELHRRSGRPGELVWVHCAQLPASRVEPELFGDAGGEGDAGGAGTAASHGLFGQAESGTLVLDEIGETPPEVQEKLLRALATGEVRAVGEAEPIIAHVRLVAATNVSLEAAVAEGRFRGDLLARLLGHRIYVPPLRERREDIPRLLDAFLEREGRRAEPTADAIEALVLHRWPANVRELQQAAQAAAAELADGDALDLGHLPEEVRAPLASRRG